MKTLFKILLAVVAAVLLIGLIAGVVVLVSRFVHLPAALSFRPGRLPARPFGYGPGFAPFFPGPRYGFFGMGLMMFGRLLFPLLIGGLLVLLVVLIARSFSAQPAPAAPTPPGFAGQPAPYQPSPAPETSPCAHCGRPLQPDWVACPYCGERR